MLHILFSFFVQNIFSFGFNDVFDSKHKNVWQHARITSLVITSLDSKGILCTLKKVLRQKHNVLTLRVSLSLRALGGFSFHRSYKHTIYCATKSVSPYVFFFVFRIARSRTVWVTVSFKARFQPRAVLVFLVLSVSWPRLPLGQMLVRAFNHKICNVYSPKAFETLIQENVTHIVFFFCVKYIFFWF